MPAASANGQRSRVSAMQQYNTWSQLPEELLLAILTLLEQRHLTTARLVSHRWRAASAPLVTRLQAELDPSRPTQLALLAAAFPRPSSLALHIPNRLPLCVAIGAHLSGLAAAAPTLTALELHDHLFPAHPWDVSALGQATSVTSMTFQFSGEGGLSEEHQGLFFSGLQALTHLKHLEIRHRGCISADGDYLDLFESHVHSLQALSDLRSLSLHVNVVDTRAAQALGAMTGLTALEVNGTMCAADLRRLAQLTTLKQLKLHYLMQDANIWDEDDEPPAAPAAAAAPHPPAVAAHPAGPHAPLPPPPAATWWEAMEGLVNLQTLYLTWDPNPQLPSVIQKLPAAKDVCVRFQLCDSWTTVQFPPNFFTEAAWVNLSRLHLIDPALTPGLLEGLAALTRLSDLSLQDVSAPPECPYGPHSLTILSSLTNLKTFSLEWQEEQGGPSPPLQLSPQASAVLARSWPLLISLHYDGFLPPSKSAKVPQLQFPPALQHLHLGSRKYTPEASTPAELPPPSTPRLKPQALPKVNLKSLPKYLQSLSLARLHITPSELRSTLASLPRLRHLALTAMAATNHHLRTLPEGCPHLEGLLLREPWGAFRRGSQTLAAPPRKIDDNGLAVLLQCPLLAALWLELPFDAGVTADCAPLLATLPSLRRLALIPSFSSPPLVTEALEQLAAAQKLQRLALPEPWVEQHGVWMGQSLPCCVVDSAPNFSVRLHDLYSPPWPAQDHSFVA